jgi:hypothetical protein
MKCAAPGRHDIEIILFGGAVPVNMGSAASPGYPFSALLCICARHAAISEDCVERGFVTLAQESRDIVVFLSSHTTSRAADRS